MKRESRLLVKYYRLSLEDPGSEESNSIVNQRRLVEDYVTEREDLWEMPGLELVDDGYTGTNFNRPGIKRFFTLLRADKVACLVVKDFSRFTRDYIELGNYAEQIFPFMGVRFVSVNDGYDSAVFREDSGLEVPFKGILNELYSRDISMKVKAAKGQLMKEGKLCSGSYPFGYRKEGAERCRQDETPYFVDEEAAEVVRAIFRMALEGKKNIEIARALNEKGCLAPAMTKRKNGGFGYGLQDGEVSIWDSSKVLKILRDERYTGTLIVGRYQGLGLGSGKVAEKAEHLWVRRENRIPVIISRENFERVQQTRPIRKRGSYRKEHHLLYRKIRCGCCGRFLYIKFSEGESGNSFFCKQPHLQPKSACFRGYVKEKEVLHLLLTLINLQMGWSEKQKEGIKRDSRKESKTEDKNDEKQIIGVYLEKLEYEIAKKKEEKAQDYCAFKHGKISREDFLERKAALQRAIEQYEQEWENINKMEKDVCGVLENHGCLAGQREENGSICLERSKRLEIQELDRAMIEKWVKMIWVYDVDRVKIELN